MKYKKDAKSFLLLGLGLVLTAGTAILGRYIAMGDGLRGFAIGTGLALEALALARISKNKCGTAKHLASMWWKLGKSTQEQKTR